MNEMLNNASRENPLVTLEHSPVRMPNIVSKITGLFQDDVMPGGNRIGEKPLPYGGRSPKLREQEPTLRDRAQGVLNLPS